MIYLLNVTFRFRIVMALFLHGQIKRESKQYLNGRTAFMGRPKDDRSRLR